MMEINKIYYAIRHKESRLFYQSNDSDYDKFVDAEFDLHFDLMSSNYSLLDDYYYVSEVPDKYKEMFSKYLVDKFYKVPPEDLELVKFEYSLKQVE